MQRSRKCKEALPKRNIEDGAARIDARVDATLEQMYLEYPETVQLSARASGVLIMPLITEAGFGFGGGYGQGALRIDNVTQEYYSASFATTGIQIGAQQYAHALFFMTDDALANFRTSKASNLVATLTSQAAVRAKHCVPIRQRYVRIVPLSLVKRDCGLASPWTVRNTHVFSRKFPIK